MSPLMRALIAGFAAGLLIAVVPSCSGSKTCDSSSCATGCCTPTNECVTSTSNAQCGNGGRACAACTTGETCTLGACMRTSGAGGGAGGGSGGGTAGGQA